MKIKDIVRIVAEVTVRIIMIAYTMEQMVREVISGDQKAAQICQVGNGFFCTL